MPTRLFHQAPAGWEEAPLGKLFSLSRTLSVEREGSGSSAVRVIDQDIVDTLAEEDVLLKLSKDGPRVLGKDRALGVELPCMILTSSGRMSSGFLRAILENKLLFRRLESGTQQESFVYASHLYQTGFRGWNALKGVVVPLPPPSVQAEIARFFAGSVALVAEQANNYRKMADTLEKFGYAVGQEYLGGKIEKQAAVELMKSLVAERGKDAPEKAVTDRPPESSTATVRGRAP